MNSKFDEILNLEEILRQAMLSSDVEKLDQLLADDLIFTNHAGQRQDKQADLDAHRSGLLKLTKLDPSRQVVKIYGDTAIVAVQLAVEGAADGAKFGGSFCFTRVWGKQKGRWVILAAHSSMLS